MKLKSGFISGVLLTVLLLQAYQVVRLDLHLSNSNIDGNGNGNGNSNTGNNSYNRQATTSSIQNRLTPTSRAKSNLRAAISDHQHHGNDKEDDTQTFSACLMLMDDNAHLIEWLAYHYHALPLRRLIVAVDPRSQTSPSEILQRWEGRMEITQWSDVDFMPPTHIDAHTHHQQPHQQHQQQQQQQPPNRQHLDDITKLFRQRQEELYARCMARLKYEGHTWVALVDTDEYIVPNRHAHHYHEYVTAIPTSQTVMSVLRQAQPPPPPSGTTTTTDVQEVTNKFHDTPCLPMARLAFGVKESDTQELYSAGSTPTSTTSIPWTFDPLDFQTLRWRWHGGRSKKSLNKISKSMIDVSRVDSSLFVPTQQVMVHLPIKDHCRGEDLWILNAQSLLVVHHYAGTWEQWSHRDDTRGKRTREAYDQMSYDKQSEDAIRPWLHDFVKEVGWWTARALLKGVGEI